MVSEALPNDRAFLESVVRKMHDSRPVSLNETIGDKVQDSEHVDYRDTDATAGTGIGGVSKPQGPDLI